MGKSIAIIDYGMGNIHSVNKALEFCGARTVVTNKASDILSADKAVLPGVGAFDDAIIELENQGLILALRDFLSEKKPLLGICLGMQLLFEESQEAEQRQGLSIFKGSVKRFIEANGSKVPHMGWNQLRQVTNDCPLLRGIADNAYVYFCHSYYPEPREQSLCAGTTQHGIEFTSVVWKENVFGVQFHPEKSQKVGLSMLKNFVEVC